MANPALEGNFGPVFEEHTLTRLAVAGEIPDYLDGRYLRNGPNPFGDSDAQSSHWFVGPGMVHGVRLRDGRAEWYRNRWVRSADVAKRLGEPARPGPVHAGLDFAANTNVIGHAGRYFAIAEGGGRPYELTGELGTVGPCDFNGTLPGGYTAHPKRDPHTGELHAVSYFFGWGNKVQYCVLGTDGRIRHTTDIEVGGSPMMHDFSLTDRYVVLYDLPVTFSPELAARGVPRPLSRLARLLMSQLIGKHRLPKGIVTAMVRRTGKRGSGFPYAWNPSYPARIGLLPREGTSREVRWFDVEPCYVFHPLNAYDDGDNVVLDVVRHPRMFDRSVLFPDEGTPTLDRWTVDLPAGILREERIDDHAQEFPRVDERLVGGRHRYGYTVGSASGNEPLREPDTVFKHDLDGGRSISRSFGKGAGAAEFVFVPESADADEDHGVLMGFVYHPDTDTSELTLLDARTLDTVATIGLPARVPYGFHGNWIPDGRGNGAAGT